MGFTPPEMIDPFFGSSPGTAERRCDLGDFDPTSADALEALVLVNYTLVIRWLNYCNLLYQPLQLVQNAEACFCGILYAHFMVVLFYWLLEASSSKGSLSPMEVHMVQHQDRPRATLLSIILPVQCRHLRIYWRTHLHEKRNVGQKRRLFWSCCIIEYTTSHFMSYSFLPSLWPEIKKYAEPETEWRGANLFKGQQKILAWFRNECKIRVGIISNSCVYSCIFNY